MKTPLSRRLVALLAAGATLAMATVIDASSSSQVAQLGQMAIQRSAHKATALSDGRVLITGGRNSAGVVIADAEIFDPSTGQSTAVASMPTARVDHTATLLKNGRVLIAGGRNATGSLSSAEIFDPTTATFSEVNGSMHLARVRHTATLLSSGKVLIAGGDVAATLVDPNGTGVTGTAELFDPTAGTFGDLVLLAKQRTGHTATLFSNDTVWLAGGGDNTIESFNASSGAFTLSDTAMTAARTGHEAFALSATSVLFFGGDANHTIDQFNPSTGELSLKDQIDGEPSSATLLANGKILVLRSNVAGLYAPDAVDQTAAFTSFDEVSVPGSTALKRAGQTATELSGDKKILVAGGVNAENNPIASVAVFNPAQIWTDKDDYQPGDPVVLSGSGWKSNENIYLFAVDSQTQAWTYGSTIQADADGAFVVNPYFIVQLVQDGANFSVTAMGALSAMQTEVKFTDTTFNSLTLTPATQTTTVGTAASRTYTITAGFVNSPGSNTVNFAVTWATGGPPAGVTASPTPAPVTHQSGSGTETASLTLNTSTNTPAGSYGFTVTGTPTSGQPRSADGTLVVGRPPAFTSADNTTFTVNTAGTFTATATGVPAPTFSESGALPTGVTFTSAGVLSGTPAFGTAGTYPIIITAQNGITPNATQNFTLIVDKIQPAFSSLTASPTIAYGTATTNLGGRLNAGSGIVPTGTASISVDSAPTATSNTFNGSQGNFNATINTSAIPVSATAYTITYHYAGDANFKSATDTSTTLTVNKASTSTAITSDTPDPSTDVQAVTVNYQVSAIAPGGGTPTGNVHVTDGVDSCDGTAAAGTCSLTLTTVGARTLTATYAGDSNFNGSASPGASHTVNASTVATALVLNSVSPNSVAYGSTGPVTFTATLTRTTGGAAVSGATVNFTVDGGPAGLGVTNGSGVATFTTYNPSALSVGSHNVQASFTAATISTVSYLGSSSGMLAISVTKGTPTITWTNPGDITYGTALSVTQLNATASVPGTFTYTPAAGAVLNAGPGQNLHVDFVPTDTTNSNNASADVTINVLKATPMVTVTDPMPTYDGDPHNATATAKGVDGITSVSGSFSFTYDGSATAPTNAKTSYAVVANFTSSDSNYSNATGNGLLTIKKATPTVEVTDPMATYDGDPHNATAVAKGVDGITSVSGSFSFTYDGSATAPTNAKTSYAVVANFTSSDSNYSDATGNGLLTIKKASATVVVTPYTSLTTTYDGHSHAANVTSINGVNGETGAAVGTVDVTNTTHTNAGTYAGDYWSFTGTVNYNNIGNTPITDSIAKANAMVVVAPYTTLTTTYDGNAHSATVTSISGVNGETGNPVGTVDVSHTTHTNAGTYSTDYWTFTGGVNYNNIGATTITDSIAKTNATVVLTSYTSLNTTYDANPHTATVTSITGVHGETGSTVGAVDVSHTTHTDAGTYATDYWFFTGTANYNDIDNTTITDSIAKASQTISWATPAAITVGTPLSSTQLNATVAGVVGGTPPGALTYTPPAGTVLGAGANQPLKVDAAGTINYNSATMTVYINVNYTFVGFLQPIDNLPITNSVTAGQTIPVKWQLKDAAGNLISDLDSLAASGLHSVKIACDTEAPVDAVEELAAPGSTVFRFDGTQFIFNWQTNKSWAGTCRLMTVTFKDGSVYFAQFTFK